jgi:hypothetical protein
LIRTLLFVAFAFLSVGATAADASKNVRSYIFGNSLIHHRTTSDETTVPHWVHRFAVKAGNRYAVDGQWGFPENFVKDLPPIDQWTFQGVPGVWSRGGTPFNRADYDAIIMNPSNFVQYKAPDAQLEYAGFGGKTQVDFAVTLFDWLEKNGSGGGTKYFIYEGWADMDSYKPFPPSAAKMAAYQAYNRGKYHDWYERYVRVVNERRPGLDVRLIPVASVISKLLTESPLKELKPTDLYSDDSPHGTATTYFLAAVIVYSMLYDAKPPADFVVPASVHPLVREHYAAIIGTICAEVIKTDKC